MDGKTNIMPTLCNRVSMQALYCKNPPKGYVKVMITNVGGEDGHRYKRLHPCSPFYIPFIVQGEKYRLQRDKAVQAEDVSPAGSNVLERYWRLHPLEIKDYDRERMKVIFNHMQNSLETLVQQAVPLNQKEQWSRRRFLGIFPFPLRKGLDEENCYGTIGGKQVNFNIYAEELPSCKRDLTVSHTGKSLGIPIKFFNS